ncbi:MAG: hypothetical protein HDT26_11230 [Subdoligranulum sp.]|nr:hypothetical protein [Subdoligranulum sp.]
MDQKRFEILYKQGSGFGVYVRVLRDTKTGVQYLLAGEGYGAGLTPLLDKDGKPIVSGEWEEA